MNATTTHAEVALAAAHTMEPSINTTTPNLILSEQHMTRLMAVAEMMATGRATVPKHLQGNKGDCLAVCMQAATWAMNPFAVAQKTHLVNGTLGYEAQLVIAVINTSGAIVGRLEWDWFGPWEKIVGRFKQVESKTKKDDDGHAKKYIVPDWQQSDEIGLGVHVRAKLRGEPGYRQLTLLMTQARTRNSTLWTEDPKQQLAYLASKRWARLYCPEVILGVYTPDELAEIKVMNVEHIEVLEPEANALTEEQLAAWEAAARNGTAAARKHFAAMGKALRALATEDQKKAMWEIATTVDNHAATDVTPKTSAPAPAPAPKPDPAPEPAPADSGSGDPFMDDYDAAMAKGQP